MTGWRPRVAIIGTGGIARVHARLIRELGGEPIAVCRPHTRRRDRLRSRRPVKIAD
jgi:predicted dehydrogenase